MKSKSNFFKKLLGIVSCMIMAVAFNAAAGATCAVAIGCALKPEQSPAMSWHLH